MLVDKTKQNRSNLVGGIIRLGPMTLTLWNEIVFPNQYTGELCVSSASLSTDKMQI